MYRYLNLCFFFILLLIISVPQVKSQAVAIKSNLLADAATSVNLGAEFVLKPQWTLGVTGQYNPWTFRENKKWKHWLVQPELRYWFCQAWDGHFFGLHLHGGEMNVGGIKNSINYLGTNFGKLTDYRYEGWFTGGGITYGYSLPVSRRWNFEVLAGFGYVYVKFDKFPCVKCGEKIGDGSHHYFGPTQAALNLVYVF